MEANVSSNVFQINPVESLIREYAENKALADKVTTRNREIARLLVDHAEFNNNSKTGRLVGAGFEVSVSRRFNETYDQQKLRDVTIPILGPKLAGTLFRTEYKPQKRDLTAFLKMASQEYVDAIDAARSLSEGQPQVTLNPLEG